MKKITLLTSKICGPSVMLRNKLEDADIKIEALEILDNIVIAKKYGIRSVPRLIVEEESGEFEVIQGTDYIVQAIKDNQL